MGNNNDKVIFEPKILTEDEKRLIEEQEEDEKRLIEEKRLAEQEHNRIEYREQTSMRVHIYNCLYTLYYLLHPNPCPRHCYVSVKCEHFEESIKYDDVKYRVELYIRELNKLITDSHIFVMTDNFKDAINNNTLIIIAASIIMYPDNFDLYHPICSGDISINHQFPIPTIVTNTYKIEEDKYITLSSMF
jgi:hypothetical protein